MRTEVLRQGARGWSEWLRQVNRGQRMTSHEVREENRGEPMSPAERFAVVVVVVLNTKGSEPLIRFKQ